MPVSSGPCVLVIDGRCIPGCSVAMEMIESLCQGFGFLSAPVEFLKKAQAAKRVRLKLTDGESPSISVLQVDDIGIALITVNAYERISVWLSAVKWTHVVQADGVRAACIKAEQAIWEAKDSAWPIRIKVRGAAPDAAQQVHDYLSALNDTVIMEQQLPKLQLEPFGGKLFGLQSCRMELDADIKELPTEGYADILEALDRRILRAQLLIEKQSTTIAALTAVGGVTDLAHSVLRNMKESLKLLTGGREAISICAGARVS